MRRACSGAIRAALAASLLYASACGDGNDQDSPVIPDTADTADGVIDADAPSDGSSTSSAVCGDGELSSLEQCEGFDLRGLRCEDQGYDSGRLRCATDCTLDESLCVRCGDGQLGGSEVCDGTVPPEFSCADWLGEGATGELTCADDCSAVVADACQDPPGTEPLDSCEPGVTSCAGGLSCVETDFGGVCLQACDAAASCDEGEYCAAIAADSRACLPQPARGQLCNAEAPCSAGLACIPAFGEGAAEVSFCALPCDAGCAAAELCIDAPSGQLELAADTPCRLDTTGGCAAGFECMDVDPDAGGVLRCARTYAFCATPQSLYGFGENGPTDAQICDLAGPTAGGRFCGLPAAVTAGESSASSTCYPVFGEAEALGACIGLCDDGTVAGTDDLDCPEEWACGNSRRDGLYYPQLDAAECTAEDLSLCAAGFGECVDLGAGLQCARRARVCIEEAP